MSAYSGIAVPQWTDAGLLFPASASKTKTGLAYQGEEEMIGKDSEVTVEIVADGSLKTAGALFGLFGGALSNFYSPGLSVFVQFSSEMPYLNIGGTQYSYSSFKPGNQTCPERGNLAITFTRSAVSNECFFYQGRYYGDIKLGAAAGPSAANKFVLGACYPQCTTAGFTGVVHAVRIYGRVLTEKEIARNAELDRMRYYGELAKVRVADGELQYRLAASVAGETGGTVALDGGTSATSVEGWFAATGADTELVATPADGYEFVGWVEARGAFLGSEPMLSLPRGDYRTVIAHFRKTDAGGYTSASYVQKGLVLHFDAIDNAGSGLHAADPDNWVDLTGNGQDATFSTFGNRPAWLANAAMTTNATGSRACYFKFTPSAASLAVANSNGPYTLQYCATSPTTLDGSEILRFVSGGAWGVRYAGSANKGQTYFQVRGNQSNQGTYGDVLTGSTDSYLLLTSGKLQRYVGIAYKNQVDQNVSGTSKTTGGGRIMSTSGPTVMGMHAVRLYDRQLTPFEVAKNARLDRVRFKGGADTTRIFSVSPEGDVARGTSTPAYTGNTATESAKGAVIAFSLTGLSTDGFDGQRNVLLETGVRDRFLGWRANGGATNVAESVDYALDDDTDFRWVFVRE